MTEELSTAGDSTHSRRRGLVTLRLFYFLSFGALGSFFPFLPLLLANRGMSPSQVGWVMVVVPLGNLLVPTLWGLLADATNSRLRLLRISAVGSGLTVLLMLPQLGFLSSILAMAAFSLFRAPLTSLADAASVEALQGESNQFSRIRVWGSLGFALFVGTLGWLNASSRPTLLIVSTATTYLLAWAVTAPLSAEPMARQKGVVAAVGKVLRRGSVITFLAATSVYYLGHSLYDVYFGLHMKALGLGDGFVGAGWAIGVGVEIALLLLAPRFFHRFRTEHLLIVCAATATVRWLGLAFISSPWILLALQGLHGVTFGLWYLGLVSYVQKRAEKHMRTTMQSVALSCVGIGMVAGYLWGGKVFELYGGQTLYLVAAAAAFTAMIGYTISAGRMGTRSPKVILSE